MLPPTIRRGMVFFADLGEHSPFCELERSHPIVVVSVDAINRVASRPEVRFVVVAVPGTSKGRGDYPSVVAVPAGRAGLTKETFFQAHQLRAVDSSRIEGFCGVLQPQDMDRIDDAVRFVLGLS